MTGKDLLMTLGTIDEAFYEEAEKPMANCQAKCNTDLRINSTGER